MNLYLTWAIVMAIGVAMIQDGICSILFYRGNPAERWLFNHMVRLVRAAGGLILIVLSCIELIGV